MRLAKEAIPLLALLAGVALGCKSEKPAPPAGLAPVPGAGFVRPPSADGGREKVAVDPANAESLYLAGQQEFIAGEFATAAEHFRKALGLAPSARVWHALGDAQLAQARFSDAAAAFRSAIELEPKKRLSWMRLGRCLINSGRLSEAIEAYREAQALQPDDAIAYREEAEALIALERDEEAIARLDKALGLDAEGAAADLKLIGQLRAKRGEWTLAVEAMRRSAQAHPDAGIYSELGDALVRSGDFPGARDAFGEAARLDPKDPFAWELVGELELRLGDRAAARAAFEAALKVKERPLPQLALGRMELVDGKREEARKRFDLALEAATGEQANEAREIARFAGELGEWDSAEKLLAMLAAEEEGAKDASLWLELAGARQALGNKAAVAEACAAVKALGGGQSCPPKAPAVVGER